MAAVTVLGAGMMGSALCVPLADSGHDVRLVGTHLDGDIISALAGSGVHPKLGAQLLPASVRPFTIDRVAEAMRGTDAVCLGVSSAGVRWAAETIRPLATDAVPILMVTKGLEWSEGALSIFPDVVRDLLSSDRRPGSDPVAITGPCIAGELVRRVPTCVCFAGRDGSALERVAQLFRAPYYHVRTTNDVLGAEICAALKNAYAMGIALAIGLHEKAGGQPGSVAMHNYEAAVFAQAVIEMQQLVVSLGGEGSTAIGLPGVGDLDVTCNGGRTGRFGRLLGLGLSVSDAIAEMAGTTLECLEILAVMRDALPGLEAAGRLDARRFPLLGHLIGVALGDAPIDVPFETFFGPG